MRAKGTTLLIMGALVFALLAGSPLGDLKPSDNLALWLFAAILGLLSLFGVTLGLSMLTRGDRSD